MYSVTKEYRPTTRSLFPFRQSSTSKKKARPEGHTPSSQVRRLRLKLMLKSQPHDQGVVVRSLAASRVGELPFRGPSYMICFEAYSERARLFHGRAVVYVCVWRSKFPPPTDPEALHVLLVELAERNGIPLPAVCRLSRNQGRGEVRGFHLISALEVNERGLTLIKALPRSRGTLGPRSFDFPWKRGPMPSEEWSLDPRACPFRQVGGGLPRPEPPRSRPLWRLSNTAFANY